MPTASRASEWSLLPDSFQTAWPALQREFPGAAVKFDGGRVRLIYGRTLSGGETPLLSASSFLSEFGGDLFGLTGDDLVLERVVVPGPDDGPARVHYRQFHGGVPMHGAGLRFTISTGRGHLISLLSSSLHPTPGPYLRLMRRSAQDAERIVRAIYGSEDVEITAPSRVIMPAGAAPEYAWQVDAVPVGRDRDAERFFISALDGRTMKRRRLVHDFADFTAEVKGDNSVLDAKPIDCDAASNLIPLQWVEVRVLQTEGCPPPPGVCYDQTVETNASGEALFTEVPATFTVTASLENDWFRLIDSFAECSPLDPNCCTDPTSPCNIRALTGDQDKTTYHFLEGNGQGQQERTIQMVETWRWLNTTRKWVADLDSGFPLGAQVRVLCNIQNNNCAPNYRFNDKTLLLNNRNAPANPPICAGQGPRCSCACIPNEPVDYWNDFHLKTIITHEYSHHLHLTANEEVNHKAWNETIADAFAAFVTGDSVIGRDLCECEESSDTRDIDTDMTWPSLVAGERINGRVMASGYWDMRVDLGDDDLAGKYLLHGIENATGAGIDPTIALLAVTADDDSGINGNGDDDLSNGSPNYEAINGAFRKHDLATANVAYVTIDWSGSTPGDVADNEDLDVAVTVDPGSLTLDPPVELRWRKNSGTSGPGAWAAVDMGYRMQEDDYQVSISSANYAVGDVIDFYVRAKVEETDKQFTSFPTQAQFDWTAIPPAEERHFFSVLVTDTPRVTALSNDLFLDPGWMVGTDEWEFGAPTLAELSEQPGNDYPFDALGTGASPQPNCYFTSNAGSVEGPLPWNLTTTSFDLSRTDITHAVVSYALWFYAREAVPGQDKFEVQLLDKNNNWRTIQTINVDAGGTTKLVRWIRQRIKVKKGSGLGEVEFGNQAKLRFIATADSGTVEAVVDEVRVWGVIDQ